MGFKELNSVSIAMNFAFFNEFSIMGYNSAKFSKVTSIIKRGYRLSIF